MRLIQRTALVALWGLLLFVLITLLLYFYVVVKTNAYTYRLPENVPQKNVALVLGASIRSNGQLSPVLKERADAAIALYLAHKVSKILVSGDNGTVAYNEVYPVGKYLVTKGVPVSDIFLDYAGFDTYSSMYRAKSIFGVTSMVVTSQRFHLPRALYIARALGIDAVGLDSSVGGEKYFDNAVRELPATDKALSDLLLHREPKFLGPQFFVTGDGSATWVGPRVEMIYWSNE